MDTRGLMQATAPDSLIETLEAMVRIDSVNGTVSGRVCAEAELCDWLERTAVGWGLEAKRLAVAGRADQLLVTHEVGAGLPWLLFDSHMDTVAVEGMTVEPFGGELRDGRVYGRGACDTKGTGAAMLWAMKMYASGEGKTGEKSGENPGAGPNNVALLFGVDEEVGMLGVASFLENDYPGLGFEPGGIRGVIVGEPTELHPVVAHHGLIRWKVTTHGVAAHSSVPHEGRSAISVMVKLIQAIETDYIANLTAEHELAGRAACSINVIHGGSATNIIPDTCVIDVDRRVAPGEDFELVLLAFNQVLEVVKEQDPSLEYTVEVVTTHAPLLPEGGEGLLATIKGVLKEQGLATLSLGAPFATHGSYYGRAGLATVVLGPGEIHKAHTEDEYISVEQLERGAGVYLGLMQAALD
jgi:acetylornithine deacetylase/succinyl-diaminopimelate desuccinylase-like protein